MGQIEEAWAEAVRPGYCESLRKQRLLALGRAVLEEAFEKDGDKHYLAMKARLSALAGAEEPQEAAKEDA